MEKKDFLSVYEMADKLRVHHNTVRRAINAGHINAFRVGIGIRSPWRIPNSELVRLLEWHMKDIIDKMIKDKD